MMLCAVAAASGCSSCSARPEAPGPAAAEEGDDEAPDLAGCPVAGEGVVAGTVMHAAITEASGLAASARSPGFFFTHNDSGDRARIFALRADATLAAEIEIDGADAIDWEAVAAAPYEGEPSLYIGDIGDNARARENVTIYVVPEPALAPAPARASVVKRLDLRYEDGARDAEALLVDPTSGAIVIATKSLDGKSGIYVADLARSLLVREATLDGLPWVTDGSVSGDGRFVALRTYGTAFVWERAPGTSIALALAEGTRCPLTLEAERQGEAIALSHDGRAYFTLAEGKDQPLWSFSLTPR